MNKLMKLILIEGLIIGGIYLAKTYGKLLDEFLRDAPESDSKDNAESTSKSEPKASTTTTAEKPNVHKAPVVAKKSVKTPSSSKGAKKIVARKSSGKQVTDDERSQAILRGKKKTHATALHYLKSRRAIKLDFDDRPSITLPIKKYGELASLSEAELSRLTLGFGGSAILLDERDLHISIEGLIASAQLPKRTSKSTSKATEPKVKTSSTPRAKKE